MNQRGSIIPVIAFLFGAAVVVLIFGYMLWPKDKDVAFGPLVLKKHTTNNNSNMNATANTNSVVDEHGVEWKKYSNLKTGLSFQYPATDNVIHEYENIFEVRVVSVNDPDKDKPRATDGAAGPGSVGIGKFDFLKSNLTSFADEQSGGKATVVNATVAGLSAVRAQWTLSLDPGQDDILVYYFNYADATWFARFDLTGVDGGATAQFTKLVQSITFDPTAGWKTYENKTYGFGFRYPPDLTLVEKPVAEGKDIFSLVNVSSKSKSMTISILGRKLDPLNVMGIYGRQETAEVAVGDQAGYEYIEGDAGCGGPFIQTALRGETTLRSSFVKCEGETNVWATDTAQRKIVLSTFTFAK